MALEALITRFGLVAIFAGAGIEGETALIVGGVLAHQQLLWLPGVVIAGASGSCAADQAFFLIGRHFRDRPWVEKFLAKPGAERALATLERHPTGFILGFRFLYGLRTVSPIAVGTSDIPRARFLVLNALAATLWALLFAAIGYGLDGSLGSYLHRPAALVPVIIGVLLSLGVGTFLIRMIWKIVRRRGVSIGSAEA